MFFESFALASGQCYVYNVPKTACHCISATGLIDTLSDIIELFDVVSTLRIFGHIESVTDLLREHRVPRKCF